MSPSLDGEVLETLVGTTRAMTGRQIALLTGRTSHSGVLDVLHRLSAEGLVKRVELNRAYLFSLNRDHLAAEAVAELAGLRAKLIEKIGQDMSAWSISPVHASMFGSAARGDGGTDSDIDVLVVRPTAVGEDDPAWQQQVDLLRERIRMWTGNPASISQLAESDLASLRGKPPPIVAPLRSDAITLAGPSAKELFGWR